MTWKQLLAAGIVQEHVPTRREIDDLRGVVARNLQDAAVSRLSADNRLGIAYEAVLVASKMAVHVSGYRIRSGVPRAHAHTLECAERAIGPSVAEVIAYFDAVRRRRNALTYDVAGTVSDADAREALEQAMAFEKTVAGWISKHHPTFT